MSPSALARFESLHSVFYQGDNDSADTFIKRGLKYQIFCPLQILYIWPEWGPRRAFATHWILRIYHHFINSHQTAYRQYIPISSYILQANHPQIGRDGIRTRVTSGFGNPGARLL
jgi:hypothetical protein